MTVYFVTGTDTNCGKTYAICQLLNYFKSQKKRPLALKPIASGCYEINGRWENEDVVHLQKHNYESSCAINKWSFALPISPHLAAREENQVISLTELARFCLDQKFVSYDPLFIEGAGGLMVPLNDSETWVDFLQQTKLKVLLVVGMRLGCINHALLTAALLDQHQIYTEGWIANCLDQNMLALEENIATLSSKMKMPLLGILPYQGLFKTTSAFSV